LGSGLGANYLNRQSNALDSAGFAHGFLALEDAEIIYKNTAEYDPLLDAGIIWNDPDINMIGG
jgi:dTDP-4-dehydrorhamnose 3,5-epimerase-like enzyme